MPDGEDEVDEEDDPGCDGQDPYSQPQGLVAPALDADGADGDEEDHAQEVDEQLKDAVWRTKKRRS